MTSTRERKERFILSFGSIHYAKTGNRAVDRALSRSGLAAFPDWEIDLMVEDCICDARSRAKRNRENRRIYAEQLASKAA